MLLQFFRYGHVGLGTFPLSKALLPAIATALIAEDSRALYENLATFWF